ncbi:MAG: FAD binding domain-containing protein [Candidatus Cloacimonetes bacterium]|nr:FAD binding domain-containing protein [Candidatus Cloacimonadota bacterium]
MIEVIRLIFFLNGKRVEFTSRPAQTALEVLRLLGVNSTKEVCSEGDCGACTIALGRWQHSEFRYKAVTACILPAARLHNTHVITAEGLGTPDNLHPIQQVIYENHATQCGFCTPGIIMSIFVLFVGNPSADLQEFKKALEGNLCRCTGYRHIVQAGEALIHRVHSGLLETRLFMPLWAKSAENALRNEPFPLTTSLENVPEYYPVESYTLAESITEVLSTLKAEAGKVKIVAGGTDLFVEANVHKRFHTHYIDISRIDELSIISAGKDMLTIGATATLAEILSHPVVKESLPALYEAIDNMSSTQIRNIATLAGNIGNASPIADGATDLLAVSDQVEIIGETTRCIPLSSFYMGYKKLNLNPTELITALKIPLKNYNYCGYIKTAKRKNVDIASVSSCFTLQVDNDGSILSATLAYGGVKEFPALALKTMQFLIGKKLDEDTISATQDIVANGFSPISDVRGSEEYRSELIRNHLLKHFLRIGEQNND